MNEDLSLLAALTQCFEKDEIIGGFHLRTVPFRTEEIAAAHFAAWRAELERWLGPPSGADAGNDWQRVWWSELRMKRSCRGLALWVRSARVDQWWHEQDLWQAPGLESLWRWDP
jgi:hypothetical protein